MLVLFDMHDITLQRIILLLLQSVCDIFVSVCLSVCLYLSVSRVTQKVVGKFSRNFWEGRPCKVGTRNNGLDFEGNIGPGIILRRHLSHYGALSIFTIGGVTCPSRLRGGICSI